MPRPIHGNANEFWSNSAKAGGGRGRLFTLGGRLLTLLPQLRVYCTATCSTVFVCMCSSTVFVYLLKCICVHKLQSCMKFALEGQQQRQRQRGGSAECFCYVGICHSSEPFVADLPLCTLLQPLPFHLQLPPAPSNPLAPPDHPD